MMYFPCKSSCIFILAGGPWKIHGFANPLYTAFRVCVATAATTLRARQTYTGIIDCMYKCEGFSSDQKA